MNDANNAGTLLPCPFCGGSAAHYTSAESVFKAEWTGHVYHCTECQARVQNTDRRTAQEMWNTRALSTPNARPAMTSHHDVAGVVAELREKQMFLLNGGSFLKPDPFLQDVADLLESQAKALSEIRDGYGPNHLSKYCRDVAARAFTNAAKEKTDAVD